MATKSPPAPGTLQAEVSEEDTAKHRGTGHQWWTFSSTTSVLSTPDHTLWISTHSALVPGGLLFQVRGRGLLSSYTAISHAHMVSVLGFHADPSCLYNV